MAILTIQDIPYTLSLVSANDQNFFLLYRRLDVCMFRTIIKEESAMPSLIFVFVGVHSLFTSTDDQNIQKFDKIVKVPKI